MSGKVIKSKLYKALQMLNNKEKRAFECFCQSPYFNKREDLRVLGEELLALSDGNSKPQKRKSTRRYMEMYLLKIYACGILRQTCIFYWRNFLQSRHLRLRATWSRYIL